MAKNNTDTTFILVWAKKKLAVDYLGGKCIKCGCSDAFVLDFHHRDQSDKDFTFKDLKNYRWTDIKKELDKCDLLCANCHTELHFGHNPGDERSRNNKIILLDYVEKDRCDSCGWDKYIGGLQFHHRNPKTKKFNIGTINRRLKENNIPKEIIDELKKCVVFCGNCHRREHIDMLRIYNLRFKIHEKVLNYKEPKNHSGPQIREWAKTMSYREIERVHGIGKSMIHYYVKGGGKDK